jgi:choline dehydrogenase-like flavoprotein
MKESKHEFLIVGSGAGGSTLACELGKRGRDVLVIERGKPEKKVGTFQDAMRYFDSTATRMPVRSKEGVILWRAFMAGGSTVVSCGNGIRSMEKPLRERGIALEAEFEEAEREMGIAPTDERLLSDGSRSLGQAARDLGYQMQLMPKFIDPVKCSKCGQCVLGCAHGGKWTALEYLKEAERSGVDTLYDTKVDRVVISNGKAQGVAVSGAGGAREIRADTVILAAGGLGTPVILQRSGIEEAGEGLFMDLLVNTYGTTKGLNQIHEPAMALVDLEFHDSQGFLLSPFVNHPRLLRAMEMGPAALGASSKNLIGIMTKTKDELVGRVYPDGSVSKPVTAADWTRLREGARISTEILVKAGADRRSIAVTGVQGGHPGGTAAIGKVVDAELQTRIDNLFVCDASVLPEAPGLPPILTIVALAKRLAKTLAGNAAGV